MKHRLLRGAKHKTTGQSLESLVKDCSLNSGRTFQQCGKATASAIKNSRLSFVKMGGRQGFGTDQQCVHKGICCATRSCWAEHSVNKACTVRPLQTFCVLIKIPFPLWILQKASSFISMGGYHWAKSWHCCWLQRSPSPWLAQQMCLGG